ncbi:hypothetical protein KFL_002500160 [Klebsormidium nitens]|uniref:EF-hand domain-containing protein n=1 Tax=Klebsormidium nitens TaxID=105231 RepID=A0A1Y1ICB5_KLENI|nr:hypothetical protein KFL_002500160 [Klebsormidium nitens]|eukprot:GAQ85718.1 hypothetical protein KFL_002500160 [Klebsormidium nitens]
MVSPSTIDARLSLDREHEDQLTQVFHMLDTDRDGQLTLEEAAHAARLLGLHLVPAGAPPGRLALPTFLQSLRRKTAELPEHALDVLASRFVSSVQLRPQSLMKAEDLRRFFLESAENVPIARLQEMIEAMDSSLEGNGSSGDDFATFLHQANDAGKGIHSR